MDKANHFSIVEQRIARVVDALVPHGAGPVTSQRLDHTMRQIAEVAFNEGAAYALTNLLTVDDVAERLGLTPRRIRAIARNRQERGFPVGWQVPGSHTWLFRPEDLEQLRPDARFRRKS